MDSSHGHEGYQQHRQSDDQDAEVSVAASRDDAGNPGDQHEAELERNAGVGGREEHFDHP